MPKENSSPSDNKASPEARLVIVDTDLAFWGDDSISLCMLLQSPAIKVLGITTTSGNVWTEQATTNTLRLLEVVGHTGVPVHAGLPSSYHAERARYYQQIERFRWAKDTYAGALKDSGTDAPPIEEPPGGFPQLSSAQLPAPEFIIEQVHKFPGKVTVLLFGPATNLAAAIQKEPAIAREVGKVVFSGGAIRVPGNSTKAAEFNCWFDPESARRVLEAGFPLTLLPLDATDGKVFDSKLNNFFDSAESDMGKFLKSYVEMRLKRRAGKPIPVWDEALAGVVVDPRIAMAARQEAVQVVVKRGAAYGATQSKRNLPSNKKVVTVVTQIDTTSLHELIYQLFSR